MNDLDICKRIAEIEKVGHQVITKTDCPFVVSMVNHKEYNPLTDDALCFRLMVKYKIEIEFDSDLNFVCACKNSWVNDENPNKAICLAIIKAHEVKQ